MRLRQIIATNTRHSKDPLVFMLEAALPTGVTLRFVRDTHSLVYPTTGSSAAVLSFPYDICEFATTNNLTIAIQGKFTGAIVLEQSVLAEYGGSVWEEVTRYTGRIEESRPADNGRYRLRAATNFRGKAQCNLGDASMPLWQAMAFDFDDFKSGEGARRGTISVNVSNASGLVLRYVEELEDWRKKNGRFSVNCRMLVVNTGQLENPVPLKELSFTDSQISCPPPMDKVSFTLGSRNIWAFTINRKIMAHYCSYKTKVECPHVAECNHSLNACRDQFNYTDHFGGFPMLRRGALFGGG